MGAAEDKSIELQYAPKPMRRRRWLTGQRLILLLGLVGGGCLLIMILPQLSMGPYHPSSARRVVCGANLRAIGQSCLMYAEGHDGRLPSSLDVLLTGGRKAYLQPRDVICPESKMRYVYIPRRSSRGDPRHVLAYEPLSNHESEGGNVLYLDGHAKWSDPREHETLLARTIVELAKAATQPAD